MTVLRALPLVILFTTVAFFAALREETVKVTVEGWAIKTEPAPIRLRIRVEPDEANRALTVGIESDLFSRSSLEQLAGDRAPITRWIEYRDVPAGEYWAVAEVYRPGADPEIWHTQVPFIVAGRGY